MEKTNPRNGIRVAECDAGCLPYFGWFGPGVHYSSHCYKFDSTLHKRTVKNRSTLSNCWILSKGYNRCSFQLAVWVDLSFDIHPWKPAWRNFQHCFYSLDGDDIKWNYIRLKPCSRRSQVQYSFPIDLRQLQDQSHMRSILKLLFGWLIQGHSNRGYRPGYVVSCSKSWSCTIHHWILKQFC